MTDPRGIRNNNPGNIRRSSDAWLGLAAEQSDPDFFVFLEPYFGLRALAIILRNYQRKHGLRTLREIAARWAPASENDTASYCDDLCNRIGAAAEEPLDLSDPETLESIAKAIIHHENGQCPYSDDLIEQAVKSALA